MKLSLKYHLLPGNVLRFKVTFSDGSSAIKRMIVVSKNNVVTTLLLTVTSNIHREYKNYRQNDIFIPAKEENSFPLNTYVQFHRIIEYKTALLENLFSKEKLDVLDPISEDLLNRLYEQIESLHNQEIAEGMVDDKKVRILKGK